MSNQVPIFVFNSLNVERGGLTKAVVKRANTLLEAFSNVLFLTLKFQVNHNKIIKKMYDMKKLDQRVKVLNFFTDIDPYKNEEPLPKNAANHSVEEEGYIHFPTSNQADQSFRYYKDGLYVKFKRFDSKGRLVCIDYFNEGRHRLRREEYDTDGYLVRVRHMDLVTNKPKLDRYFSRSGKCYLTAWINPGSEEGRCHLFGPKPMEFNNLYELYEYWINSKLKDINNPVVFSDARKTDELVSKLEGPNLKKVAVLHSTHYSKPYTTGAPLKSTWEYLFNHFSSFDRVVFLTQEQKEDVIKEFGGYEGFRVIPHSAEKVEQTAESGQPSADPHLAVTLARYDPIKRHKDAIKAFQIVVNEIPDAKYYIYGFGPEEENLKKYIKKLGLQNNVFLKGYANDTVHCYQEAACSILTSSYEGFGLVLTESLAAGTPVITYNFKYGPKDILNDGRDGYIVKDGDINELAEKILKIMKDPLHREELSENALEVTEHFSEQRYKVEWFSLLEGVQDKPKKKEKKENKLLSLFQFK